MDNLAARDGAPSALEPSFQECPASERSPQGLATEQRPAEGSANGARATEQRPVAEAISRERATNEHTSRDGASQTRATHQRAVAAHAPRDRHAPDRSLQRGIDLQPAAQERTALVLEIEEFAVHDGPGIRTTVFFKGCPLRCVWCHNPEAVSFGQELMLSPIQRCSNCDRAVSLADTRCPGCGTAINPRSLRVGQVAGVPYTARQLADVLLVHRGILQSSGGGITFSGGEPLSHAAFLQEIVPLLRPLHLAVETSGQGAPRVFAQVVDMVDLVMMDIKHADAALHRRYTGRGNELIVQNLRHLCTGDTDFVIRIPLIPGVNDSRENMEATAAMIEDSKHLLRVEILPYNAMASAKYRRVGRPYRPDFDTKATPHVDLAPFRSRGITCEVL